MRSAEATAVITEAAWISDLRREEYAAFELGWGDLVGASAGGRDEYFIGNAFGFGRVNSHANRWKDVEIVRLAGLVRFAVDFDVVELDAGSVDRLTAGEFIGLLRRP